MVLKLPASGNINDPEYVTFENVNNAKITPHTEQYLLNGVIQSISIRNGAL